MISNDVNVIFAYLDINHKFYAQAGLFVKKNQRRKYALLVKVHNSFLNTYQNFIYTTGSVIVKKVLEFKNQERYQNKSADFLNTIINAEINKFLREVSEEKPTYKYESLIDFKNMLLKKFSLIELFKEEGLLGEFRELFITNAEDYPVKNLNRFIHNFKRFDLMKLRMYKNYEDFLDKVKMKDYEDKIICAELFCYGKEKGKIKFLTFDNKFKNYLKKNGKEYDVEIL